MTVARIAGSSDHGASAMVDDLVSAEFSIKVTYLDSADNTCKDNTLNIADTSYKYPNEQRFNEFEFQVQETGDARIPTIIPGKKLITKKTLEECEVISTLEVYFPLEWNEETEEQGMWKEVRSNSFHTQFLTVDEEMYISFDATQADYLDSIVADFYDFQNDMTLVDESFPLNIMLPCRIRHFSPANGAETHDYFYLHVYGSEETAADLCGFDAVLVQDKTSFWQDRHYTVGPVEG
jgi:hypothetical protein